MAANKYQYISDHFQSPEIDKYANNYFYNSSLPNGDLQIEIDFRLQEIALHHQIAYSFVNRKWNEIEGRVNQFKKIDENRPANLSDEEDDYLSIKLSQMRSQINSDDGLIMASKSLADETFVIMLWSTIEQFLCRNLTKIEACKLSIDEKDVKINFRWDQILKKYKSYGIDLISIQFYPESNECRVLNNKIKHSNYVDEELSTYENFKTFKGVNFKEIELPLQKYHDMCYIFICEVLKCSGNLLQENNYISPHKIYK